MRYDIRKFKDKDLYFVCTILFGGVYQILFKGSKSACEEYLDLISDENPHPSFID